MNNDKESVFLKLVHQHKGILHKVSKMYADLPENREDLQQEIIIQLWKSFSLFESKSEFSTWMYRVAINTAITYFRKEKKRTRTFAPELSADTADEIYDAGRDEQLEIFYQAIQLLGPIEKALMFYYMEGLSHKETALQLGISEINVRVKLSRTKEKLRNLIKKQSHGF